MLWMCIASFVQDSKCSRLHFCGSIGTLFHKDRSANVDIVVAHDMWPTCELSCTIETTRCKLFE